MGGGMGGGMGMAGANGGAVTYPSGAGMGQAVAGSGGGMTVINSNDACGCAPGGAWGSVGAMCCEVEGSVTSAGWKFVGQGQGSFNSTPTYNYVGEGCGSYEKEQVMTYHLKGLRAECLGLLCLIPLGLLLLWYLMNKPDAPVVITTTPTP